MSEFVITSRDNNRVRRARKVRDGKIPDEIFIEGVRLSEQAAIANLAITDIFYTEHLRTEDRVARLLSDLDSKFKDPVVVSENVFASLSDTKTPQGIAVLAMRPGTQCKDFESILGAVPLVVIMHKLNNPSNAGAIIRAAEGAGSTGIIATEGTTDLYSSRALRGAMGSSFRLPIWAGPTLDTALAWCREQGVRAVCADVRGSKTYTEIDWTTACAIVVGPEAEGLNEVELASCDDAVRIPMRDSVDSLNAAVATAVILFEAARQRMTR